MIGELFRIDPEVGFIIKDERLLLIPEFKELVGHEKYKDALMVFVYAVCDYYSPYIRIADVAEREKLVALDMFKGDYAPQHDKRVKDAMAKYQEMQEHPLMEQYKMMVKNWKSMSVEVNKMKPDEITIDKRIAVQEKLQKYVLSIEAFEKVILEKNAKIGGLSNMQRSLSIIEQRLRKKQLKK
jgi:hypothetical protein